MEYEEAKYDCQLIWWGNWVGEKRIFGLWNGVKLDAEERKVAGRGRLRWQDGVERERERERLLFFVFIIKTKIKD
jgi:hypothetical protein